MYLLTSMTSYTISLFALFFSIVVVENNKQKQEKLDDMIRKFIGKYKKVKKKSGIDIFSRPSLKTVRIK